MHEGVSKNNYGSTFMAIASLLQLHAKRYLLLLLLLLLLPYVVVDMLVF
jgi:hypothetical protein